MTESVPEISVVIPHLNQPGLLRCCLQALRDQRDAPSFETIVVDNGSPELPEALCSDFGAQLLVESEPGPGPARNKGVSVARAALLAFIDADCLADSGWLAAIAAGFRDPAAQVLGGDVRIAHEDPENPTVLEAYESIYAYRMEDYIHKRGFTGTGNLALRKDVFSNVGPFGSIKIAEDIDWGQRATRMGYPPRYVPEMKVYHPARKSFGELYRKWDRHLAHFYADNRRKSLWWARWMAQAIAVGLSPALEAVRILRSERITGFKTRCRALLGLTRIRIYRSLRMLNLGFGADPARLSGVWNRN